MFSKYQLVFGKYHLVFRENLLGFRKTAEGKQRLAGCVGPASYRFVCSYSSLGIHSLLLSLTKLNTFPLGKASLAWISCRLRPSPLVWISGAAFMVCCVKNGDPFWVVWGFLFCQHTVQPVNVFPSVQTPAHSLLWCWSALRLKALTFCLLSPSQSRSWVPFCAGCRIWRPCRSCSSWTARSPSRQTCGVSWASRPRCAATSSWLAWTRLVSLMVGEQASKWFITVRCVSKVLTEKKDCSDESSVWSVLVSICHLPSATNRGRFCLQLESQGRAVLCVLQLWAGFFSSPAHLSPQQPDGDWGSSLRTNRSKLSSTWKRESLAKHSPSSSLLHDPFNLLFGWSP